jgi:hypothetical protein
MMHVLFVAVVTKGSRKSHQDIRCGDERRELGVVLLRVELVRCGLGEIAGGIEMSVTATTRCGPCRLSL